MKFATNIKCLISASAFLSSVVVEGSDEVCQCILLLVSLDFVSIASNALLDFDITLYDSESSPMHQK
jgi:hypothetical protein